MRGRDALSVVRMSGDQLSLAEAVLAAQPFNDLIGAQITSWDEGKAVLELVVADHHRQQFGLVHGGVLAYLIDNTLTFACGSVLGPNIVTNGMTMTYLTGARTGTLRATATVIAHDDRKAVASVLIEQLADGVATPCAVGQGGATVVKPKGS